MFIDKALQVSNEQAVTVSAASTDSIDFGQPNPNVGLDDRSNMVITVDESADKSSFRCRPSCAATAGCTTPLALAR
jgi:hypothetical protein